MAVLENRQVTLSGTTVDGGSIRFETVLALYLDSDRFTPADSLEFTTLDQVGNRKVKSVVLRSGGKTLFEGIVDVQRRTIGRKGSFTSFVCRSSACLMLDNEVKPYWYFELSSAEMVKRHAVAYGAKGARLPFATSVPQILAKKGISHWAFIEQYCRLAYQKQVYIDSDGYLSCTPFGAAVHRFSNREKGAIRFLDANLTDDRYSMISKLCIKTGQGDYGGDYRYTIHNSAAQNFGVRRERYYHPGTEWQESALVSARALMEEKQLDYFEIELLLPGLQDIRVGDQAQFDDGGGWYSELYVSQVRLSADSGGLMTKVKLWYQHTLLS